MKVVHITSRRLWDESRQVGQYSAPGLSSEGFIHCSTSRQAVAVGNKFYRGQRGLVLLVIDPERLTSSLKWEPPAEGAPPPGVPASDLFPHIYGPINLDAVTQVLEFEPSASGEFVLPAVLQADA